MVCKHFIPSPSSLQGEFLILASKDLFQALSILLTPQAVSQYLPMAKSQKKCTIYLRQAKGKRTVGTAQKQEMTVALHKPHYSAGKRNWASARRAASQGQSVHASLKCQSWGSPNTIAQHDHFHMAAEILHLNHSEAKEYSEEQTDQVSVFPIWPRSTSVPMISPPALTCYITFHSRLITSLFPFNYQLCIFIFLFNTLQSIFLSKYMNVASFKAFLWAFPHQSKGKHLQNSYQVVF